MQKVTKILNILTIAMFAITVVLAGVILFFGGESFRTPNIATPVYTDQLLWWAYLLFGVDYCPCGVSIPDWPACSPDPKQAVKTLYRARQESSFTRVNRLLHVRRNDHESFRDTSGPDNVPKAL